MKITWKALLALFFYTLGVALVQGFVYLSLAGGVWCIGYMLSDHFRKDE